MARFYILARRHGEKQWTSWSEADDVNKAVAAVDKVRKFGFEAHISEKHAVISKKRRQQLFEKYGEWVEQSKAFERGEMSVIEFLALHKLIDVSAVSEYIDGTGSSEDVCKEKKARSREHLTDRFGLSEVKYLYDLECERPRY